MEALSVDELAGLIGSVFEREHPTLFAGAGVGCRVGFPDWRAYVEHLAAQLDAHGDQTAAKLARERIADQELLAAASVFKTSTRIPEGERWRLLAEPFSASVEDRKLERLQPLCDLRFSAIVTTNFDSSIHRAHALSGKWIRPIERGESSLATAGMLSESFIARIHGRAEEPQSMVVDEVDYRAAVRDSKYLDFVLDVLRHRSCLFLGFSFLDPAIRAVLEIFRERFGPVYPALHSALIPVGADQLERLLLSVNIKVGRYDPTSEHVDLWRALRLACDRRDSSGLPSLAAAGRGHESAIHRFMAFAYSQIRSRDESGPIAELVQDAIVMSSADERGVIDVIRSASALRAALGLTADEAAGLARESVGRLVASETLGLPEMKLRDERTPETDLDSDLEQLSEDVLDRMFVRGAAGLSSDLKVSARTVLERCFMLRAWDLAAHFAGSSTGWGRDLPKAIDRICEEEGAAIEASQRRQLADAIVDLLSSPEDRQALQLSRIGRAAFGLQLVLSSPRHVLLQRHSLPEAIFLDASIALPALVFGHPLHSTYNDALQRLGRASRQVATPFRLLIATQFLNEIISHRAIATVMVENLLLEDVKRLQDHMLFYGAANTNVYVAAFAAEVLGNGAKQTFASFLKRTAPYTTETELARFLETRGLEAVDLRSGELGEERFVEALNRLREGYSTFAGPYDRPKKGVLVEHEASQIVELRRLRSLGQRAIFVTADSQLRRVLASTAELRDVASECVSQAGLVALVDVMVGLGGDDRSMARLVWARGRTDDERALFEFFVKLGLRQYREGMAMEMQEAARSVAQEAAAELKRRAISLDRGDTAASSNAAAFLERYEDHFFRYWREAEVRKRQEGQDLR